jgi:hypothetical protein
MTVRSRNDEIWEGRMDREADRFTDHPARTTFKWVAVIAGICVALAIIIGTIGWIGGWFSTAANVAGPGNVTTQYHAVIEDYNALQAAAGNYCQAKDTPQGPNSPSLIEDPAFAYAAQYRHITVDYNERQNNIFEAGVVGPSGYPKQAPSLDAMSQQVC